ncbi:MAG: hypothetical protein DRP85_02210 [Candidatus Makaraimicrobium thalassicum]|nr:MAG: hypothetical protein DRP85_02210 [Candidatus Omnitrophota bacterium]
MFIKKKNIVVIIFSSVIIAVVFVSTLIGYTIYVQWKEDSFALKYRNSIYRLTAELFRKEIAMSNVNVKVGVEEPFPGMPLLEGSLRNNFNKTIDSIRIEVSFLEQDGTVVYNDWFHPLGEQHSVSSPLFSGMEQTRNLLLPGEGISFRHLLRNCPRELIAQLSTKSKFARSHSKDKIRLVYSITGLSVL